MIALAINKNKYDSLVSTVSEFINRIWSDSTLHVRVATSYEAVQSYGYRVNH